MNAVQKSVGRNALAVLTSGSLAFAFVACGPGAESKSTSPSVGKAKAEATTQVQSAHPTAVTYEGELRLSATIEPRNTVEVVARVEGPLVAVQAELGDEVLSGAVLARIAPDDLRARLARLDAELSLARADLDRNRPLVSSGLVATQQLEQLQTKVATLQADRLLVARQLRDTTVRAPFAGSVAKRVVSQGAYVRVGEPLFEIVSTEELIAVLELPERIASAVQIGASVTLEVQAQTFDARIVRIAPVGDAATRTVRAEAEVPRTSRLKAGAFLIARIRTGESIPAFRLPRGAIFTSLGEYKVARVVAGKIVVGTVQVLSENDAGSIVEGVSTSDVIVTRSPEGFTPGTQVQTMISSTPENARGVAP